MNNIATHPGLRFARVAILGCNMKANLQDAGQMKAFMAQFKEEYGRGAGEHGARVEADEERDARD